MRCRLLDSIWEVRGEPRLYVNEIDAATGPHLGSLPREFTHLALIDAVLHIIRAGRRLELRALERDRAPGGL